MYVIPVALHSLPSITIAITVSYCIGNPPTYLLVKFVELCQVCALDLRPEEKLILLFLEAFD